MAKSLAKRFGAVDEERLFRVIMEFHGDGAQLEAAIGFYLLGCMIGGHGLELMHSHPARMRYARTLGFRNGWPGLLAELPARGPKTKDLALFKVRVRFRGVVDALRESVSMAR